MFRAAYPFREDIRALPVKDLDATAAWYGKTFGMTEVDRRQAPVPTVMLERDAVRIGFAVDGGDASQDGAAILVDDIDRAMREIEARGGSPGNRRIDERDDGRFDVFFVIAPDGLCYYFHQPLAEDS